MLNIKKIIVFLFVFLSTMYSVQNTVSAQDISLSITPPLLEVTIAQGKEYRHIFTITNSGAGVTLKPKIVYFTPTGQSGEVEVSDVEAPDWVRYSKDDIKLDTDGKKDFTILITPPEDTQDSDHFLTLLLTTDTPSDLGSEQNSSFYQAEIGSNLLITVSKDGKPMKNAEIVEFKTKKYLDSFFGKMSYELIVKNTGGSYIKPIGSIKTNFGDILKLASVNILSNYERNIPCIENEVVVNCKLDKIPFWGVITSKAEFTIDEEPKVYKIESKTYVFPFIALFGLIFALILLTIMRPKLIFKLWRKRKSLS